MVGDFYEGSDAKLLVDVKALGFDQEKDDYTIELFNNNDRRVFYKKDVKGPDSEGNYFLPVTKDKLKAGSLIAVVTVKIPDEMFPNRIREEKAKPINLGPIKESIKV